MRCEDWEAEILPLHGANLALLKKGSLSVLRTPKSLKALSEAPVLYGNPILFPPNRTKDGRFQFMGKDYLLPINEPKFRNHLHGSIYNAPFEVTSVTGGSTVCCLHNSGEWFPFPFTLSVSFSLDVKGLIQHIEILNSGDTPMPVLLGFHTTFNAPELFSVPIGRRWETDDRYIPTSKLCPLNEQELLYKTGCHPEGKIITGYYTAEGLVARIGRVLYEASAGFTQWVLFNQGGEKGLLCVEPQSGGVNGLNIPGGHSVLPAGKTACFELRFTVDDSIKGD